MKIAFYRYLVTAIVAATAAGTAWLLYRKYVTDPWTRDSQIRANIVGIAPRVAGPIINIPVHDNQEVKKGDVLFEIDPADYKTALGSAKAAVAILEANLLQKQQEPIFLAAIVGRLFWPVLPEAELRKRFIEFFSTCSNFLSKRPGHGDDALSDRLTLIPVESVSWVKGLKGRYCPASEVEKIKALTLTMRRLPLRLSSRAQTQTPGLPESIARLIDPVVEKAKDEFRMVADSLTRVFREGSTRVPIPSTKAARESFRSALQEVRSQNLLAGQTLESVRNYLLLAHRLDIIADDLETCRDQTLALALQRYWDDYSL